MEVIIKSETADRYTQTFLNYKPRGLLLRHLRDAHSYFHLNPDFIDRKKINMYAHGFVDDTRPNVTETMLDVQLLGAQMNQSGQEKLSGQNYTQYVKFLIQNAITKLENVDINNVSSALVSSNEIFEILFGHLLSFDDDEINPEVLNTPEITHLKPCLIQAVDTFSNSSCLENKLILLGDGLFVVDGITNYGYGVKSESELEQIKSTYFNPNSEQYLPGAVQFNLQKIRKLLESV